MKRGDVEEVPRIPGDRILSDFERALHRMQEDEDVNKQITPTSVAREAGHSRALIYAKYPALLESIRECSRLRVQKVKTSQSSVRPSEERLVRLKARFVALEASYKSLIDYNAELLHRLDKAEEQLRLGGAKVISIAGGRSKRD